LQKLIAENSLNERIRFLGYVEDIVGLLKTADLFLFASNSEGSPNAVLEASAYGIPVVSSKLPCVTELVGNDYPYLFETGNVFDAVQKLKNALGNVCKYDFNGLKNSIKNEYSLSNMTGQYLNVIFNNPLARE
jgi:glycosyltransferase involved in cell wall biosynthesis